MDVVIVVWNDIAKTINDDNFDEKEILDNRLIKMKSVGFFYKESESVILLVQEFSEGKPRDYVTIPKSLIISISVINEGK
jgi:hypothetical protein